MSRNNLQKKGKQIKIVFGSQQQPAALGQPFNVEAVMEEMGLQLQALAQSAGVLIMQGIMEEEALRLAGRRHEQTTPIDRWGEQKGYVILGGQKVRLTHQRLRTKEGKEVVLESYRRFQQQDERTQVVYQHLVHGISCRTYEATIQKVQDCYGIARSSANREMVEATTVQLRLLLERDLSVFDLCLMVIDGIHVGDTVFLVALGVDTQGKKQILGFREGSTENSAVCLALFEDMVARGLKTDRTILSVLDGSKALRSAVRRFFGEEAPVQRCQEHKRRNVLSHLPEKYHAEYTRKLQAAYKMRTYRDAEEALHRIVKDLTAINHSAAESLSEGLEETLTVHKLELPEILRSSFCTTNTIESTFSRSRHVMRNVRRWQNSAQKHRWIATALLEGEKKFRRVKGYRSLQILVAALADKKYVKGLDSEKLVA